jgi:hypothetical protein
VATFTTRPEDTGDEEDGAYHDASALHVFSLPNLRGPTQGRWGTESTGPTPPGGGLTA